MIEAYFGLKRMPFGKEIKSADLITCFDLKEAEARLNHIKQYRGIMCLTGEPGSGKTSLVRKWVEELNPQSFLHCYTPHVTVSRTELYRQTNSLLNLPSKSRKSDLFRQIQTAISQQYSQGKVTCRKAARKAVPARLGIRLWLIRTVSSNVGGSRGTADFATLIVASFARARRVELTSLIS